MPEEAVEREGQELLAALRNEGSQEQPEVTAAMVRPFLQQLERVGPPLACLPAC